MTIRSTNIRAEILGMLFGNTELSLTFKTLYYEKIIFNTRHFRRLFGTVSAHTVSKSSRTSNSFVFNEQGIEFAIFKDGQFDFNVLRQRQAILVNFQTKRHKYQFQYRIRLCSAYVQYDHYGAVIQIENTPIYYDYYGRISQAGNVHVNYDYRGRVSWIGRMRISYDRLQQCHAEMGM